MNKTQFIVAVTSAAILPFASIAAFSRVIVNPSERMLNVATHGPSRISTVNFCLGESGVKKLRDLITDTEVETFDVCMREHT
jgi:hypothetical protein